MKKLYFTLSILLAVLMSKAQIYAEFHWGYPQCSEETLTFTDWSTGDPADHWEWFVDNNPEGTNSPVFIYNFPQVLTQTNFDIKLYVESGPEADSITHTVTIYPLPIVDLGADDTICAGETITLDAGTGYMSYLWSTTSNLQTVCIDSAGTGIGTVSVYVTVTDITPCLGTDTINITFEDCVGIKEIKYDMINIFPNPTTGKIILQAEGIVEIEVFDITGKTLTNTVIASKAKQSAIKNEIATGYHPRNNEIDLNSQPKGMYIIKVTTDKETITRKIIKQ